MSTRPTPSSASPLHARTTALQTRLSAWWAGRGRPPKLLSAAGAPRKSTGTGNKKAQQGISSGEDSEPPPESSSEEEEPEPAAEEATANAPAGGWVCKPALPCNAQYNKAMGTKEAQQGISSGEDSEPPPESSSEEKQPEAAAENAIAITPAGGSANECGAPQWDPMSTCAGPNEKQQGPETARQAIIFQEGIISSSICVPWLVLMPGLHSVPCTLHFTPSHADETKPRKLTRAELRAKRAAMLEPSVPEDEGTQDGQADAGSQDGGEADNASPEEAEDRQPDKGKVSPVAAQHGWSVFLTSGSSHDWQGVALWLARCMTCVILAC